MGRWSHDNKNGLSDYCCYYYYYYYSQRFSWFAKSMADQALRIHYSARNFLTIRHVLSITAFCIRIYRAGSRLSSFKLSRNLYGKISVVDTNGTKQTAFSCHYYYYYYQYYHHQLREQTHLHSDRLSRVVRRFYSAELPTVLRLYEHTQS